MQTNLPADLAAEGRVRTSRDERQLIQGVLTKERKATALFVDLCTDWIYGFVHRRLMPRSEQVEDMMQDILFAAWQSLPTFREESSLRSWVLGIARHKVEDYYRRRICEIELPEEDDESEELVVMPIFDQQLDSALEQDRVQKTMADIPEAYGVVLMWRYRDDKSAREIAELTGKSEKAVERLLARAREAFRRRWNDARS
jgi:RNA polymerase sigma-70 factor (ECF subfamily)